MSDEYFDDEFIEKDSIECTPNEAIEGFLNSLPNQLINDIELFLSVNHDGNEPWKEIKDYSVVYDAVADLFKITGKFVVAEEFKMVYPDEDINLITLTEYFEDYFFNYFDVRDIDISLIEVTPNTMQYIG